MRDVALPDLFHVDPSGLADGHRCHIVRVSDGPLTANDVYGHVRGVRRYPSGAWRIRWDAAVAVAPGEPSAGVLHVAAGGLVAVVSREQWRRLVPRRLPE
jgi:hypothetical protein